MPFKVLLLLLACALCASPQGSGLPTRESFSYNIEWRLFNAGKAKVEFTTAPPPNSENQIRLHLESTGIVSKLFKVEDDFTSVLKSNLCAESTQMTAHEGSRHRDTKVTYDGENKKATYLERDL